MTTHWLDGKAVLVTGGTGSFGRRFVETVLRDYNVARLVVFSRDEAKQEEMRTKYNLNDPRIRYFIGDVRDRDRLYRALSGIDAIVHAAALKQVPALEYNPIEAVKTNIDGSENLINAAIDRGVKRVIAISTDKAVNPINLYGATKLVAEKLFTQGNIYADPQTGTKLACTRYGNVIGSRGSVIPLFLQQREKGVITVTDERMTRFWLTLDQGVKFVLHCLENMAGGEVFVPKLPSMSLKDVANVIAPDCRIENIGIRAGEKLHEVLISRNESPYAYELDDMYVIEPVIFFRKPADWPWSRYKKMESGTKYASDTNTQWMSREELLAMATSL
ncbi:MAG TPA: UDP-N-acetylglucosamine 4,6-dehydratase (inverting) [Thermoanaerobaculia bacterium]|nr:UDP-N-acetylglucosamine 4,6-dehydratase (inverting) [Thermoanaerobaculia bacterium]